MKKILLAIIFVINFQMCFSQTEDAAQLVRYQDSQIMFEIFYPKYYVTMEDSFEIFIKIKNMADSVITIYSPEHFSCSIKKGILRINLGFDSDPQEYFSSLGFINLNPKEVVTCTLLLKSPALTILMSDYDPKVELNFFYSTFSKDLIIMDNENGINNRNHPIKLYSYEQNSRVELYEFKYTSKLQIKYYDNPYLTIDGQICGITLPKFDIGYR